MACMSCSSITYQLFRSKNLTEESASTQASWKPKGENQKPWETKLDNGLLMQMEEQNHLPDVSKTTAEPNTSFVRGSLSRDCSNGDEFSWRSQVFPWAAVCSPFWTASTILQTVPRDTYCKLYLQAQHVLVCHPPMSVHKTCTKPGVTLTLRTQL